MGALSDNGVRGLINRVGYLSDLLIRWTVKNKGSCGRELKIYNLY